MDKTKRDALARMMRRNHGLITTPEAEAAGISARELSRAHARGEIGRARHATYRPPGMPVTWEDELAADIAACKRPAVVSHSAAARLHNFRVPGLRTIREITVEGKARPKVAGEVEVHRTGSLPNADRMMIGRLPCTMVERTVIDLAERLSPAVLLTLVDDVIMSNAASRYVLHHRAEELWRGRKGVHTILKVTSPDAEASFKSKLEKDGAILLRRAGVRDLRFNVVPHRARAAGLTDVVSETDNLIVDWDGLRFHAGPGARQRDNDKANAAALGGYTHLRFTWKDQTTRPDHIVGMVARARRPG